MTDVNRNIRFVLVWDVISKIPIFAITLLLINYLDTLNYAKYTFAIATFIFLSSVISSIINIIFIVDPNSNKADYLWLQIIVCCVLVIILSLFHSLYDGLFGYVCILLGFHILFMFNQSISQKKLLFNRYYYFEVTRTSLYLLFVSVLVFCNSYADVVLSAESVFIAQILATAGPVFWFLNYTGSLSPRFTSLKILAYRIVNSETKFLPFYFLILNILLTVDVFMLRLLSGSEDIAEFGAALRYYGILQMILIAMHKVLLPTISSMDEMQKILSLLKENQKLIIRFFCALPVLLVSAYFIIPFLDGGKYPESKTIFIILALSAYLSLLFSPYANLMIKLKGYKLMSIITVKVLVFHIFLSYILVIFMAGHGAALANVLSYAFLNFMIYKAALKRAGHDPSIMYSA